MIISDFQSKQRKLFHNLRTGQRRGLLLHNTDAVEEELSAKSWLLRRLPRATSWYYCCFAHNTDVAYTRMVSSSKVQDILIKENKGIKRNLRRNRVHFQHNKKQKKQTQKGSNDALTSHYQSSLFLSISVLSKFTAPLAALLPFVTPSKITLQCKNEDLHVMFAAWNMWK